MIVNNSAQTAAQTGNQNSNSAAKQTPTPKGKKTPPALKSPTPTPKLILVQGTPASTPKPPAQQSPTPSPKPKIDQTPNPTPTPSPTPAPKTSESSSNGTKGDDTSCGKCSSQTSTSQAGTVIIRKKKDGTIHNNKPRVVKFSQKSDNRASNTQFLNPIIARIASIKFGSNSIALNPGETLRVKYEVLNSDSPIKLFDNKSDVIEKIELDDDDVVITASKKSGNGRVAVYLEKNDEVQNGFNVTVKQPMITDLDADTDDIKAVIGSEKFITFTAATNNGTEVDTKLNAKLDNEKIGKLRWSSANELTFTPAEEGEGKIKVSSSTNPNQTVEIPVSVTKKAFDKLQLAETDQNVKLKIGSDPKFTLTEIPVLAVNNDESWGELIIENSNPQVAVTGYDNGKLKIAANSPGITMITVKAKDYPSYSKVITVTVEKVKVVKGEDGKDQEVTVSNNSSNDNDQTPSTSTSTLGSMNPFSWSGYTWLLIGLVGFIVIVAGVVIARRNGTPTP
jgi:hypothetical protein